MTSKRRVVRAGAGRPAEAVQRPEDAGFCIPTAPATGGRRRDRKADSRTGGGGAATLSAADKCVQQVQKGVEEVAAARFAACTRCAIGAFLAATLPPGTARARLTCFGLGSLRFGSNPRLQLAMLVWLRDVMTECLRDAAAAAAPVAADAAAPAAPTPLVVVDAYDPIFDADDVAVFAALGIGVLDDEGAASARRVQVVPAADGSGASAVAPPAGAPSTSPAGVPASAPPAPPAAALAGGCAASDALVPPRPHDTAYTPTVFFMPHCNADLYDALLRDNGWPDAVPAVVAPAVAAASAAASIADGPGKAAAVHGGDSCHAAGTAGSEGASPLRSACVIGNSFCWYARSRGVVAAASGIGAAAGAAAAPVAAGVAGGCKAKAAAKRAMGGAGAAARPSADDLTALSLVGADVLSSPTAGPPVPYLLAACAAARVVPAAELPAALASTSSAASAPPAAPAAAVLECAMPLDGCDELLYRAMDATSLHFFVPPPAPRVTAPA